MVDHLKLLGGLKHLYIPQPRPRAARCQLRKHLNLLQCKSRRVGLRMSRTLRRTPKTGQWFRSKLLHDAPAKLMARACLGCSVQSETSTINKYFPCCKTHDLSIFTPVPVPGHHYKGQYGYKKIHIDIVDLQ